MLDKPDCSPAVKERIRSRLRQHYLRWLANQPAVGCCRSKRWRDSCRAVRRRVNLVLQSTLFACLIYGVGVCMFPILVVVVLGFPVLIVSMFFVAPENHHFANEQELALVALTRLTGIETFAWPLILLSATFHTNLKKKPDRREFYKARDVVRRKTWRFGAILLMVCAAAASISAILRLERGMLGSGLAMIVTIALGSLTMEIGTRLLAVRLPRILADPAFAVGIVFLVVPNLALWVSPEVTRIAGILGYLGPFGWLNQKLFEVGRGDLQQLGPLALATAAMVIAAWQMRRSTRSFAFLRRVIAVYRAEESTRSSQMPRPISSQALADELRSTISGHVYSVSRIASFIRSPFLFLIAASMLAVQGLLLILASWLVHLANANNVAIPDTMTKLHLLAANVAGWSLAITEILLLSNWHLPAFNRFSARPISVLALWTDVQFSGLKTLPLKVLMACPYLVVTAVCTPEYLHYGLAMVLAATFSCFALRTALVAGTCYASSVLMLRTWISSCLLVAGLYPLVGAVLLLAITGTTVLRSNTALNQMSLNQTAVAQLSLQLVALAALLIASLVRRLVSRPRKILFHCW